MKPLVLLTVVVALLWGSTPGCGGGAHPADAGQDAVAYDAHDAGLTDWPLADGTTDGPLDGGSVDGSVADDGFADVAGDAGTDGQVYVGRNNGTVVTGASMPGGSTPSADLRKVVPVTTLGPSPEFTAWEAVIARASASKQDAFYAIVPIRNTGARPYCFVTVESAQYLDAGGTEVTSVSFRDVNGSVGRLGSVFTPTCLSPGEVGYFCDVQILTSYDAVASVSLTISADPDTQIFDPLSKPVPTGYSYDQGTKTLSVTVENVGMVAAKIFGLSSFYILLDSQDTILWWHTLRTGASPDEAVIPAGSSVTLVDPSVHYEGSGTRLRVFLDWADET